MERQKREKRFVFLSLKENNLKAIKEKINQNTKNISFFKDN